MKISNLKFYTIINERKILHSFMETFDQSTYITH